ncbi:MAG: alpha/beta hydrolase [Bacteroidetes bacterium HGW-Bacteroidetes-8]|jgi:acetyl esterase/lipase|nr:MAG: alpha/beta hydrolase [Bacteroidetes bacterium HGW-Bacteroidetes-8]
MQSLRGRFFIWLIKNRHLFKFKLKPEVVDENFSVKKFRDEIDRASARVKLPASVSVQKVSAAGINAEWITPENPVDEKVILYIHGGGFISGSCLTHRMHVAKFAIECGMRSLVFDYRLAPEHPFPAALDDCVLVYRWLLNEGYKPDNIIVGGESAGANLTLTLLLALKAEKIAFPKAAFSISPITDLSCSAKSFEYNAKNDVAPMGSWIVWTNFYIAGNETRNPLLSPLFGNFEGIPPLYICVGTHEIHLDDCINVAKVARDQGVDVTLRKWEGMIHAFPLLTPLFPEAKQAFLEVCDFIKR